MMFNDGHVRPIKRELIPLDSRNNLPWQLPDNYQ